MSNYPENDSEFRELTITKVEVGDDGSFITNSDGMCFYVKDQDGPIPKVGSLVRFYGCGIGSSVRGVFIDGRKYYYRTEAEEKIYSDQMLYGKDAQEWLDRWDSGSSVWSIEMGGLGPGYEQAIQITTAEILRHLLVARYDHSQWQDEEKGKADSDAIRAASFKNEVINKLGLSGAQYGAAFQIATKLYMEGPIKVMNTESIKDRHIQVSKNWPSAA